MKNFVVYTALTGNYDNIEQPSVIDDRFDYVLFTDSVVVSSIGVWQVRSIPYENEDLTRVSRYPKMHPEELLKDYKASLYHDANIQITDSRIYDRVAELYSHGIEWAGIKHPYRDCIYDEAYNVYRLEKEELIFRWCHRLRQENYPRHNGLFENNVIFRVHNNCVSQVDEMWWRLYESHTRRDQLTLCYVLWKMPIVKIGYILEENENACNSSTIRKISHKKSARQTRGVNVSFLEHARCRCRNGMEEKKDCFRDFHYWLYGLNPKIAKFLLFLWGWYALLVYGTIIKFRAFKRHKKLNDNE